MKKINIFWHRRDLRSHDNPGLYYALKEGLPVLPIFIFDKNILDKLDDKSDARVTFIHDRVCSVHDHYQKEGSGLAMYYGTPHDAFKSLLSEYTVNAVYTNRDYEPYALRRDIEIQGYLKENEVSFYDFKDHVIFEKKEILTDAGDPYKVYTPYKNKWIDKLKNGQWESFTSEKQLNNLLSTDSTPKVSLSDMGFKRSDIDIPKNEIKPETLENYEDMRNYPSKNGTTRLGIHLRFGTRSIREALKEALDHSDTWRDELIWRDFYIMVLSNFPKVVDNAFKSKYDNIPWSNNEEHFEKWCEGKTGYPIVDAGMRELNTTGYMHNRVRMITASFLTKHLLIDWRWGEQYFAKKLLDFELASNNGGWQWAAGTGTDAQPYFRVFNPTSQQDKFDKNLAYIKKWIPEFGTSNYPDPIVPHKEARERAINTYKEAVS